MLTEIFKRTKYSCAKNSYCPIHSIKDHRQHTKFKKFINFN